MDPGVGFLTGYHVTDGASRFIAVEGTRDAAARIVDVARRVRDASGAGDTPENPGRSISRALW